MFIYNNCLTILKKTFFLYFPKFLKIILTSFKKNLVIFKICLNYILKNYGVFGLKISLLNIFYSLKKPIQINFFAIEPL